MNKRKQTNISPKNKHEVVMKKTEIEKPKRSNFFFLFLVFVVPFFLYLQTVKFSLVDFDDYLILTVNNSFLSDFSNIPQAFSKDAFLNNSCPFYRPLQTFSYMVDCHISGIENPWAFHLTNILLLGIISCCLFLFLKNLKLPQNIAALAALLYCVHPLFLSSVAWLPSRGDLLLTVLSLLSMVFLQEYLEKGKTKLLIFHWISFTIALFCKETAAFLPFIFILYFLVFFTPKKIKRKYIFPLLLYGFSGMVWFWLRHQAIGNFENRNDIFTFGFHSLIKNLRIIPESITSFFLPFNIDLIPSFSLLKLLIGIGFMILLTVLLFLKGNRPGKEKLFCLGWFLLLLLPTLFFRATFFDYLYHRFLLPYIGMLVFLIFTIPKKWIQNKFNNFSLAVAIVVVGLGILTFKDTKAYSDPMTFYNNAIMQNPHSPFAYNNRGWEKISALDYLGAFEDFKSSVMADSTLADSHLNKGIAEFYLKNFKAAEKSLNKGLAINPTIALAYYYKGLVAASMNDIRGSIPDFEKATELNPNYIEACEKKVIAKYLIQDFAGVIEDCRKILKIDPGNEKIRRYQALAEQEFQKQNHH